MSEVGRLTVSEMIEALLDWHKDRYPPEIERFYSREKAKTLIHAALSGYGVHSGSTAGAYVAMEIFDALGLKAWTFDEAEAALFHEMREETQREKTPAPATEYPT